jgi:hypothetical protein
LPWYLFFLSICWFGVWFVLVFLGA